MMPSRHYYRICRDIYKLYAAPSDENEVLATPLNISIGRHLKFAHTLTAPTITANAIDG